jgi:acyl carrier protein
MATTIRSTAGPGCASMALQQWLDYRLGELAAAAFLLAAAEHRADSAVAWARRRFEQLGQAILAELAHRTHVDASALLEIVAGYSAAIGDIDQAAPGTGQAIDPLLRREYTASQVTPPPRTATAPSTLGIVHVAIAAWLRAEQRAAQQVFDVDTPFTALGIDSLATASIAADLEQRTGIPVHPEVFHEHPTPRALAAWLDAA